MANVATVERRYAAGASTRASLLSSVALLALGAALAWALWRIGGPLGRPSSLPAWHDVQSALTASEVSDAVAIGAARAVAWAAIAYLDAVVLLRVAVTSAWRLTGGAGWAGIAFWWSDLATIPLVRRAADSVLGAAIVFGGARPPLPSSLVGANEPRTAEVRPMAAGQIEDGGTRTGSPLAPDPAPRRSLSYQVVAGDTLTEIARRFYGDASRYKGIADANRGRVMTGGGRFEDPASIEPGWTLEIPLPAGQLSVEDGALRYRVQRGDSLWTIARDLLGNAFRWPQLFALNQDRDMGGGRRLVDANLIRPGWELVVPLEFHDLPTVAPPASPRAANPAPIAGVAPAIPTPPNAAATPASPATPQPVPGARPHWRLPSLPSFPDLSALGLLAGAAALAALLRARGRLRWIRLPARGRERTGDALRVAIAARTLVSALRELGCEAARAPLVLETGRGLEFEVECPLGGIDLLLRRRHDLERRLACAIEVAVTGPSRATLRLSHFQRLAAMLAAGELAPHVLPLPVGATRDGISYLDLAAVGNVTVTGDGSEGKRLVRAWLRTIAATTAPDDITLCAGQAGADGAAPEFTPAEDLETIVRARAGEPSAPGPAIVAVVDGALTEFAELEAVLRDGPALGVYTIVVADEAAAVSRASSRSHGALVRFGGFAEEGADEQALGPGEIALTVGERPPLVLKPVHVRVDDSARGEALARRSAPALEPPALSAGAAAASPEEGVVRASAVLDPDLSELPTDALGMSADDAPPAADATAARAAEGRSGADADAPAPVAPATPETDLAADPADEGGGAPAAHPDEAARAAATDAGAVTDRAAPQDPPASAPHTPEFAVQEPLLLDGAADDPEAAEAVTGPRFTVHCFGDFRVEIDGVEVQWRVVKSRELLAYLLAQGNTAALRDEAAEALWGDETLTRVKRLLEEAAYRLRTSLRDAWPGDDQEQFFTAVGQRYRLRLHLFRLDIDIFNARLRRARSLAGAAALDEYQRALELYTGDFLETDYWEWAQGWRLEYRKRFVAAAREAAALALELRDEARAVGLYEALVLRDAMDEDAARALMRCHARQGDMNGVRKVYKNLTEALRRELDDDHAEPALETSAILRELLARPGSA
ncbi:MAG: BTAD domain-containing putative transcriptional regulator [Dehalococcoidia bacterium]